MGEELMPDNDWFEKTTDDLCRILGVDYIGHRELLKASLELAEARGANRGIADLSNKIIGKEMAAK